MPSLRFFILSMFLVSSACGGGESTEPGSDEGTQIVEDIPLVDDVPVGEDLVVSEDLPAIEDLPVVEDVPAVEDLPAVEDVPAVEDLPAVEDVPVVEDLPVVEDISPAEDVASTEDTSEPVECSLNQCGPGAICSPEGCVCPPGFIGDPLEGCYQSCVFVIAPGDPVPESPCEDHAYCNLSTFMCACDPGYGGDPYEGCGLLDSCKTHPESPGVAQMIFEGSGSIPNIKYLIPPTPGPTDLIPPPLEIWGPSTKVKKDGNCNSGKIDIVVTSEGYKSSEIHEFRDDAELWKNRFLDREPYETFQGAFNIWIVPLSSEKHLPTSNPCDGADCDFETRFGLHSSDGGIVTPSGAQDDYFEAAVMDAVSRISYNDTNKYPGTSPDYPNLLEQVVTVILVRKVSCSDGDDPTKSCDGFSGRKVSAATPSGSMLVNVAIANSHLHELGHAFAHLKDEYRKDDFKDCTAASKYEGYNKNNWTLRSINNYSYASEGDELPWKHLLYGAGINTDSQYIGAFEGAYTCWEGAFRPEHECLMNGTHSNPHPCTGVAGTNLRQTNYCNWCREIIMMRILDFIGHLAGTDKLGQWEDDYRAKYWSKYPLTLPGDGYPVTENCDEGEKLIWEAPPTGLPCYAGVDDSQACPDETIATNCLTPSADDFDYCTRDCTEHTECDDLFTNGRCVPVPAIGVGYCRPAVAQGSLSECTDSTGDAEPDLCDDHVPNAQWCGSSSSAEISYCTRECDSMFDCHDLFPGGEEWGCCSMGGAGVKLCRPAFDPKCD